MSEVLTKNDSTMDCVADYRVGVEVVNNHLLAAIEKTGHSSIRRFAFAFGVNYGLTLDLISMKQSPLDSRGCWRQIALQLADVFGCLPEDLFNEQQMTAPLADNRREIEMTTAALNNMLPEGQDPHEIACETQLHERIEDLLDDIDPYLANILRLRFGLGDEEPLTLEQVGLRLNITPNQARAFESRALRIFRHPSRANLLRSFVLDE